MVGDIYTPLGFFVTIDGMRGELVCTDEFNCVIGQGSTNFIFTDVTDYVFIPEGTTTQIAITVGQMADSKYFDEVRFNEVLGIIDITTTANCMITSSVEECSFLGDRVGSSFDVRITALVGDYDFSLMKVNLAL